MPEHKQPTARQPSPAGHRVVLLGASNLTIGFPLILEGLRSGLTGPLAVAAALGHGRSFGLPWTRVLHRELPGITRCGLWEHLQQTEHQGRPTNALITDIGNDLIYGVDLPQIVDWVETCLQRLRDQHAQLVLTLLPVASVAGLSHLRYHAARMIFFPGKGSALPIMLDRVQALDEQVRRLAAQYAAQVVEPPGLWYGLDPIHIRRSRRVDAWRQILGRWPGFSPEASFSHPSLRRQIAFLARRPAHRRAFGRHQHTSQPVLHGDGVTVSLF